MLIKLFESTHLEDVLDFILPSFIHRLGFEKRTLLAPLISTLICTPAYSSKPIISQSHDSLLMQDKSFCSFVYQASDWGTMSVPDEAMRRMAGLQVNFKLTSEG